MALLHVMLLELLPGVVVDGECHVEGEKVHQLPEQLACNNMPGFAWCERTSTHAPLLACTIAAVFECLQVKVCVSGRTMERANAAPCGFCMSGDRRHLTSIARSSNSACVSLRVGSCDTCLQSDREKPLSLRLQYLNG